MADDATETRSMSKAERFEEFHRDNPHIYEMLVRFCREWRDAGHESFGIRAPWERMRWAIAVQTKSADFKLNDHYCPYYSRLIAAQERDLRGLLTHRRADEADAWIADFLYRKDMERLGHGRDGGLFALPTQRWGGRR
jgi:hypothetical protein